jgi:hypothetical protein
MSSVWPWIGYLLEFLEADIVTVGAAGRGPKLMDQIGQKSILFQHFPHTFSSYRFMVTGIGSRPVTQREHRILENDHAGSVPTSGRFSSCLYMQTGKAFCTENGLWHLDIQFVHNEKIRTPQSSSVSKYGSGKANNDTNARLNSIITLLISFIF